jgi:hypothetical protein
MTFITTPQVVRLRAWEPWTEPLVRLPHVPGPDVLMSLLWPGAPVRMREDEWGVVLALSCSETGSTCLVANDREVRNYPIEQLDLDVGHPIGRIFALDWLARRMGVSSSDKPTSNLTWTEYERTVTYERTVPHPRDSFDEDIIPVMQLGAGPFCVSFVPVQTGEPGERCVPGMFMTSNGSNRHAEILRNVITHFRKQEAK